MRTWRVLRNRDCYPARRRYPDGRRAKQTTAQRRPLPGHAARKDGLPLCKVDGSGGTRESLPADSPASPRIHLPCRAEGRLFVRRVQAKVDAAQLFASLFAHLDNAFWLDSSLYSGERARFSFMGGAPESDAEIVRYYAAEQTLVAQHGPVTKTS